jgi:hypothetical protein
MDATVFGSALEKALANYAGVIIGGLITFISALGGVVLTNRAHDRRLKEQLAHDREVKNRDRELSLRKEVYLAAAEAISAGLIAIGRFANLEIHNDKLTEEYLAKSPSISKVHVVAKESTAKAVMNFSGELGATFLRLFAKRIPFMQKTQEIAILRSLVDSFTKEQSRILELMKQHNLDGSTDQRKWEFLQNSFDFERNRIEEASKKADGLAGALYMQQLKFMEECAEETLRLSRLLGPVVASVRRELDLPIDEIEYNKLIEEGIAKQGETIKEFAKQVQSLLPAQPRV